MSLFKSLQSIPGVITIFHSPASVKSEQVLKVLNQYQVNKSDSNGNSKPGWFSKFLALNSNDTKLDNKKTKEIDEILYRGLSEEGKVSNDFKNALYYIDIQSKFPTIQQFKLIWDYANKNESNLKAFEAAFPKLVIKKEDKLVYPESNILKSVALKSLNEVPEGYFKIPLVVDWQKCKIRSDLETVKDIVEEYHK